MPTCPPWIERPTLEVPLDGLDRMDLPAEAQAAALRLLQAVQREIPGWAGFLADLGRLRTWGRFHREIRSIARRAGVSWRDVMLANLSYDLVLGRIGCSTMALATRSGPVLARNMDWWPEDLLAQASYVLRCRRNDSWTFTHAGWPGGVGVVTGLSARGFALALNAVSGPEKFATTGYPVLLFLRRVVEEAADFHQALDLCARTRLCAPALITLVGTANDQRVVIERSPSRRAMRWADGNGPLFATNHYRLLPNREGEAPGLCPVSHGRYGALTDFFAEPTVDRDLDDAELLFRLTDPRVLQNITAQHVVVRPRSRTLRLYVPRRLLDPKQENS